MVLLELPKNLTVWVSSYVRHKYKLKTEIEYGFIPLNFDCNVYLFGPLNYPRIKIRNVRKIFKDFWSNVENLMVIFRRYIGIMHCRICFVYKCISQQIILFQKAINIFFIQFPSSYSSEVSCKVYLKPKDPLLWMLEMNSWIEMPYYTYFYIRQLAYY